MFSDNLKRIMDEKGITPAALHRKTGITMSSITFWLQGKFCPGYYSITLLLKGLGCEPNDLFKGEEYNANQN